MARNVTANISMPASMGVFVRKRINAKGYGNTSEYFRHLVREDERRAEEERVEQLLIEGLKSGPPVEVTPEWWAGLKAEVAKRVKKRQNR